MLKYILIAVSIYLGLLALLFLWQRHLIYFPDRSTTTPVAAGIPEMQTVKLQTTDGVKLEAWYAPARREGYPTLLYLHGNAGNIAYRGFIAREYIDRGYGVFLLSWRGYGGSAGTPSEDGFYRDARAALAYLNSNGIAASNIVLIGESIGSAVALKMATEYPVRALVLQAPFTSLREVASIHYSFFYPLLPLLRDQYDSLAIANQVRVPVLLLHGTEDTIIPPDLGRKLFNALPEPKKAIFVPHVGHNDLFEPAAVDRFLQG